MIKSGIESGHRVPPEGPEDLFGIAKAFEYSRALHLAVNVDVFTELAAGPLGVDEISARTGVEADALEKILIVAAAMGLLVTNGERFSNSLLSDRYLVRGKPDYIGDAIWLTGNWWGPFNDLSRRVLTQHGEPDEAEIHVRFINAMHDYASNLEAERLAEAIDLSGRKSLLDLGGGPGTYSIFFCRKYPDLTATVLDLPETEPVFREVVQSYGMADRVKFERGDLHQPAYGEGYDAALVSNMMHGDRGEIIPPRIFEALSPGGLIIIRDFILYPDRNGPISAALFNMRMGAYTRDEMYDFLKSAGFVRPSSFELGNEMIVLAHKPG